MVQSWSKYILKILKPWLNFIQQCSSQLEPFLLINQKKLPELQNFQPFHLSINMKVPLGASCFR